MITPQEPQSPAGIPPISENPSMNPPVPDSPPGVGMPDPGMSSDQMKGNLQSMMAKLQAKKQQLDSSMLDVNKTAQESQSQLFSDVYDFFQKNGIDPTDPQQVKAFLAQIQQTNPDVYQQVVEILNKIMAEDPNQPSQPSQMNEPVPAEGTPMGGGMSLDQGAPAPASSSGGGSNVSNNMNINPNETTPQSI